MLVKAISQSLLLPETFIFRISKTASQLYKQFEIPKKGTGTRTIHHPSRELKSLQRWLACNVVSEMPVHERALAYTIGQGIRENARMHSDSKYMLKMDFKNFFPSITSDDVRLYLQNNTLLAWPDWGAEDTELFCNIVCRNGCLTIGAPTSPSLSNAICVTLDRELDALARGNKLRYSRYADDMCFSSPDAKRIPEHIESEVLAIVNALRCPKGLRINPSKTRHTSSAGRQTLTGLVITSQKDISVGHKRKRHIKSMVHSWDSLEVGDQKYLVGYLSFLRHIEPGFVAMLEKSTVRKWCR